MQNSLFLTCEYYPPGNYIGEFEYVFYPHLAENKNSQIYILPSSENVQV